MPLIRTKLLPATNTKGTRIKAYYQEQSVTVEYSYTSNLENNHVISATVMLDKLGMDWLSLGIQTERLNDFEFVHIWSNSIDLSELSCLTF